MNRSFVIVRRFAGPHDAASVLASLESRVGLLGGVVARQPGGFQVLGAKANVELGFMADIDATIAARDVAAGVVDVTCQIGMRPNGLFWFCVFFGFCTVFAWIVPVLYFVCDPRRAFEPLILSALPGATVVPLPGIAP